MFKRKTTEKPKLPKEYVWNLDIDGEEKIWKCLVTETTVTTYEGDVERKHLKVMEPKCKEGVLQIDTITSIYGKQVPFQLERFIPYIKPEEKWMSSDTTKQDRLDATVAGYKRNCVVQVVVGIICILASIMADRVNGAWGDWSILRVFGIFFIIGSAMTMVRLHQELKVLEEEKAEAAEEKAKARALKAAAEEE